jgi:hypothetical protein
MEKMEKLNIETEQLRDQMQTKLPDIPMLRWEHSSAPPAAPRNLEPGSMAFRVGDCTVRVRLEAPVIKAEWSPAMPKHLTKKEWKQYRDGRDAFTKQIARTGRAMTVEI